MAEDTASAFAGTMIAMVFIPLLFRLVFRRFRTSRWELATTVVLGAALFVLGSQLEDTRTFDPYDILGVLDSDSQADIKRAYRRLSLHLHPDKPNGNAAAFGRVAKAYEALTDPVAAENYRIYGHPDGKQSTSIGIALPAFLLEGAVAPYSLLLAAMIGVGFLVRILVRSGTERRQRTELLRHLAPELTSTAELAAIFTCLSTAPVVVALAAEFPEEAVAALSGRAGRALRDGRQKTWWRGDGDPPSPADTLLAATFLDLPSSPDNATGDLENRLVTRCRVILTEVLSSSFDAVCQRRWYDTVVVLHTIGQHLRARTWPVGASDDNRNALAGAGYTIASVKSAVEGEDDDRVCVGDTVTFTVKVTHKAAPLASTTNEPMPPLLVLLADPTNRCLAAAGRLAMNPGGDGMIGQCVMRCQAPHAACNWQLEVQVRAQRLPGAAAVSKCLTKVHREPLYPDSDDEKKPTSRSCLDEEEEARRNEAALLSELDMEENKPKMKTKAKRKKK